MINITEIDFNFVRFDVTYTNEAVARKFFFEMKEQRDKKFFDQLQGVNDEFTTI